MYSMYIRVWVKGNTISSCLGGRCFKTMQTVHDNRKQPTAYGGFEQVFVQLENISDIIVHPQNYETDNSHLEIYIHIEKSRQSLGRSSNNLQV